MKRNFTKTSIFIITFLGLLINSSCSFIEKRSLLGDADKVKDPVNVVTKEQYNSLLKKYEALLNEKQVSEAVGNENINLNKPEILDALSKVSEPDLAETVNVFDDINSKSNNISRATPRIDSVVNPEDVEKEIELIRAAVEFVAQNKFNKAMTNLKMVENSKTRQIKVNAKFLIGEILFKQKEFDLAMQVFEELIATDAFSGVVLKTLGRLIVCADKLKLEEKQQRYHSMLHDFFES